ncbi:hypothetical protein DENSPDRAFT_80388 [Dentipellis sp. KUC8613]|nr:hypothetical protein DENSPDRAFT_80388 [Dentipellis sp. KUC8613]
MLTTFILLTISLLTQASILPRQTIDPTSFPPACQSACTTPITQLEGCSAPSCVCSAALARGLTGCMSCIVSLTPSATVVQEGQAYLDGPSLVLLLTLFPVTDY